MEPTNQKHVVLVATDFSPTGDNAIVFAENLARQFHGKIVLLHVLDNKSQKRLQKQRKDIGWLEEKLKEEAVRANAISGVETSWLLRRGSIIKTIADVAGETGALFMVAGTHGKKGIQFLSGSFILKLIKRAPVPAFAIQKAVENTDFKDIIYPLDTTPGSTQKVKWAVQLNKLMGSRFHIFAENPGLESYRLKLRGDLNLVTRIMEQNGVGFTVTHAGKKGSFAGQVVDFAKDKHAGLIMVSTDPGKITWAISGSSDEKLIYNMEKIPVMCINSKDVSVIVGGL